MIHISRRITKHNISCFEIKHTALRTGLSNWGLYTNHPYIAAKTRDQLSSALLAFFSGKTSAGFVTFRKQNWSCKRVCHHIEGFRSILIRLAFTFSCRGSPESSAIMNSVYSENLGWCDSRDFFTQTTELNFDNLWCLFVWSC